MLWARIAAGIVAELITTNADVATLYTPEVVAAMHKATNDVKEGWTFDGAKYAAPVMPQPTPDDELATRINAGLQVTATDSQITGTYAIDPVAQQQITGLIALIGAGGTLPASPVPFPDIFGQPHNFTAQMLTALGSAMSSYVFALRQTWGARKQGIPAPWPSQPVALD